MNKDIDIKDVKGMEITSYLPWFEDVPKRKQVESESTESIIRNIFNRKYYGLVGSIDGKPVSLLVYYMLTDWHISFKFIHAQKQMAQCYMAFMEYLNRYGIESFEFESVHEPKLWSRMFPGRVRGVRSTYRFDIAGLFPEESKWDYDPKTMLRVPKSKSQEKRLGVQDAM